MAYQVYKVWLDESYCMVTWYCLAGKDDCCAKESVGGSHADRDTDTRVHTTLN